MEIKTLLITGGGGFIGKHLTNYFYSKGYTVFTTTQNAVAAQSDKKMSTVVQYKMGTEFMWGKLPNINYVIHLAWDLDSKNSERNVSATLELTKAGISQGVKEQIFFSSFSAHKHALSKYGSAKYKVEQFFNENGLKICRPGLVVGDGGVYDKIVSTVKNNKFIPLIDGGSDSVPTIEIDKLCLLTEALLKSSNPIGNFFEPSQKTLRSVLTIIAQQNANKPIFVNIPSSFLLPLVRLTEKVHLPLPITSENILGMVANRLSPHTSNIHDFLKETTL